MPSSLSEEKARHRHDRREAYEVVIGEPDHPRFVVCLSPNVASVHSDSASRSQEGNGDWVSVYFMDDQLRWYLRYSFQEIEPDKLFLTLAIFRDFVGATNEVLTAKTFAFKEDGHILIEDRNLNSNFVEEREASYSMDMNWESYPRFGEYDHLCLEQRTITG
jgi:hypothetical protein